MNFCTKCGFQNTSNLKFCIKCGNKFQTLPATEKSPSSLPSAADTISFGIGAKIWFSLCGILNILTGFANLYLLVIAPLVHQTGSFVFLDFFSICLGGAVTGIGIGIGILYLLLLVTNKQKWSNNLFGSLIALMIVNTLYIAIAFDSFISILPALFSPILHIVILYAILAKHNHAPRPAGTSVTADTSVVAAPSKKCCPVCGSTNLQVTTEKNTSGGGYNAADGCCGYMLLGPLGLLCGACGSKVKTTNKTFFVCMDCGKKFAK